MSLTLQANEPQGAAGAGARVTTLGRGKHPARSEPGGSGEGLERPPGDHPSWPDLEKWEIALCAALVPGHRKDTTWAGPNCLICGADLPGISDLVAHGHWHIAQLPQEDSAAFASLFAMRARDWSDWREVIDWWKGIHG